MNPYNFGKFLDGESAHRKAYTDQHNTEKGYIYAYLERDSNSLFQSRIYI
jgi:hypothetical protein